MLISSSLGTVEVAESCLYAGGMVIVMTFLVRVGVASQNENRGANFTGPWAEQFSCCWHL